MLLAWLVCLLTILRSLLCESLIINVTYFPKPSPGDMLFISLTPEPGDPLNINLELYNLSFQNMTTLQDNIALARFPNPDSLIPRVLPSDGYVVRASDVTTSDKIQDSAVFEIFPSNNTILPSSQIESTNPSAIQATTTPSPTPSVPSMTIANMPSASTSPKPTDRHVAKSVIVGAIIGVVVIIIVIITFLWYRHRRNNRKTPEFEPRSGRIRVSPFPITTSREGPATILAKTHQGSSKPGTNASTLTLVSQSGPSSEKPIHRQGRVLAEQRQTTQPPSLTGGQTVSQNGQNWDDPPPDYTEEIRGG